MKRAVICLLFFVFFLPQKSFSNPAENSLRIITPSDKVYTEGGQTVSVILRVKVNAFDSLKIFVDGGLKKKVNTIKDKEYICSSVNVCPGANQIKVVGLAADGSRSSAQVRVFVISPIDAEYNSAPDGFTRLLFHSSSSVCFTCHQMEPKASDEFPDKPSDSSCYICHKDVTNHIYVHGPSAAWACLTCHDPKVSPRYETPSPAVKMCAVCHGESIDAWKKLKHQHGPFSMGRCTTCHSPHGSDWEYWVRKFPTDLCLSCHVGQTGDHIITFFDGKPHPIRGKPDPRHPGKQLSCASCHSPHASDFEYQLFGDHTDFRHFCTKCHRDKL